jgi:hypothetical protein
MLPSYRSELNIQNVIQKTGFYSQEAKEHYDQKEVPEYPGH